MSNFCSSSSIFHLEFCSFNPKRNLLYLGFQIKGGLVVRNLSRFSLLLLRRSYISFKCYFNISTTVLTSSRKRRGGTPLLTTLKCFTREILIKTGCTKPKSPNLLSSYEEWYGGISFRLPWSLSHQYRYRWNSQQRSVLSVVQLSLSSSCDSCENIDSLLLKLFPEQSMVSGSHV